MKLNTRKSNAVEEWMAKEYGSWEDHKYADNHPYAILKRFGGKIELTKDEVLTLIKSGQYHSTAWDAEDIDGGQRTINGIAAYVTKLNALLN